MIITIITTLLIRVFSVCHSKMYSFVPFPKVLLLLFSPPYRAASKQEGPGFLGLGYDGVGGHHWLHEPDPTRTHHPSLLIPSRRTHSRPHGLEHLRGLCAPQPWFPPPLWPCLLSLHCHFLHFQPISRFENSLSAGLQASNPLPLPIPKTSAKTSFAGSQSLAQPSELSFSL